MGLFSRAKGQPVNGLARRLSLALEAFKHRVADCLNRKTRRYSSRKWLVLLVCFCLLVGGFCLYLIISSIS